MTPVSPGLAVQRAVDRPDGNEDNAGGTDRWFIAPKGREYDVSKVIRSRHSGLRLGASLAVIAFSLAAAGAATAQDAPVATSAADTEVEAVVVTGFRGSLASAIQAKRLEAAAVDVIKAEDIADFPDLNLSESIQRIPGVAITRDAGEGRQISVRGLGPQFTRVRINGMEALSTVGGTDAAGGTNRSRSFDFNVFASDLFNSITVRKTASAETEEGSLGATVDLVTARPFDYQGFTMAASGQVGYNDLSEEYDPRGAFLISNTFADGTFGALFSVAWNKRKQVEEGASTVRWQSGGFGAETTSGYTLAQLNSAFHPRIPRYDLYNHDQERLGATVALQWRPSEATKVNFDILYADFDATREEIFLESAAFSTSGGSGLGGMTVTDAEIQGNTLVYGVFDGVSVRSEARFDELSTTFKQYTLDGSHAFSDRFRVNGIVGYAESIHENPIQTTLLFDSIAKADGYVYDYRGDSRLPLITYGSVDVTDPTQFRLSQIRLRPQYANNSYTTYQGVAEYDVSDSFTLKGGVAFKKYEYDSRELRRSNGTTSNQEGVIPASVGATPLADYSLLTGLSGRGLSIPAGNPGSWLIPNLSVAARMFDLYDRSVFPMGIEPALGNNTAVEEKDSSVFVQGDFDTTLMDMPFRGNFGVRYVKTDQSATGYVFTSGSPLRTTVDTDYTDTLPSMNLVLEPWDNVLIRFGASKVMTRPNLGQLSPGASVTVSGSNRTVSAGNPDLDPFRATSYDLSLEWYFAPQSLVSLAFFYKDIDSFVQTIRETRPFTGNPLGLPDSVATAACPGGVNTPACNPTLDWTFNLPASTPGGPVKGLEIGYQQPFSFLPAPFDNLGFTGNFTYVESEIEYLNSAGVVTATDDLTGLSRRSYNATLYYEDDQFSARVSAAYRSGYLTTIPGRNGNASESTASTLNVDVSSTWTVNDNFKLTFEGLNLTDEVNDQYLDPDDRTSFYHHYGRQFFVGFRYTY